LNIGPRTDHVVGVGPTIVVVAALAIVAVATLARMINPSVGSCGRCCSRR
jgi:hypothetical protein